MHSESHPTREMYNCVLYMYVFVCVCLSYVIKNCVEPFKTGIWEGQDSYEHSTGESWANGISRPGTRDLEDYIVSPPATALRRK
jgi:hypothetical protein